MSSREKFDETKLPPIESFYDQLNDEPLENADYERAQKTWTHFVMQTLKYYHNHYLLSDAMSYSHPVGKFQFLSQTEVDKFDTMSVPPDSDTEYIIECDLIYHEHLQSSHSDYSLAPEHLTINAEMLSPFATQFIDKQRKSS